MKKVAEGTWLFCAGSGTHVHRTMICGVKQRSLPGAPAGITRREDDGRQAGTSLVVRQRSARSDRLVRSKDGARWPTGESGKPFQSGGTLFPLTGFLLRRIQRL